MPAHLRDAHYAGARRIDHGKGYRYPHDYPGGVVAQQYAPDELAGREYYVPSDHGAERGAADRLARLRAILRGEPDDPGTESDDGSAGRVNPSDRQRLNGAPKFWFCWRSGKESAKYTATAPVRPHRTRRPWPTRSAAPDSAPHPAHHGRAAVLSPVPYGRTTVAPTTSRRTRLSAALGAFALVAGLATTIATTQSAQAAPAQGTATYLVQLTDAPAAGYTGGVARLRRHQAGRRHQDRHLRSGGRPLPRLPGPAPGRRAARRPPAPGRSTATRSPSTASPPA